MNSLLFRVLLALLPVLGFATEPAPAFLWGMLTALILTAATVFLLGVRFIFPWTVWRVIFFLSLLALAALALKFFALPPFFLLSLFLLVPPEFFRERKNWDRAARKMVRGGLLFGALLTGHRVLMEVFSNTAGLHIFELPAGSYLLMGLALAVAGKTGKK